MKIGILIPTYNRKNYLVQSLGSVLQQTYRDSEVIVIDNVSTDGTAEFMASVSDPRVSYIVNEKNIGMIGSINKGIKLYSDAVEWCTILSDDDFLDKDFIKNLLQAVISLNAKSIIHSHRIFIDQHGNTIKEAVYSPAEETAMNYIKMRAFGKRETYLTGVMFNRKAFNEINGYPVFLTGLATDDAFIFALSLKDRLVYNQSSVAFIRIHDEAESRLAADGILKLQTLKQFGDYCERAIKARTVVQPSQLKQFHRDLHTYLRALYSSWWFSTLHYRLITGDISRNQLIELITLVNDNWDKFSFRLKFATMCYRLTGIFPEVYVGYRACWDIFIRLVRFFHRTILGNPQHNIVARSNR